MPAPRAWSKFLTEVEAQGVDFEAELKGCADADLRAAVINDLAGFSAMERAAISTYWARVVSGSAATDTAIPPSPVEPAAFAGEPRSMDELLAELAELTKEAEDANARTLLPLEQGKLLVDEITARCLKDGTKFSDPHFAPCETSLNRRPADEYPDRSVANAADVAWSRPGELNDGDAALFKGDTNSNDVCQGSIGNCYMVAQIAAFAETHVNGGPEAAFYPAEINPAGIYGLRFWSPILREWRIQINDDLIPNNHGYPVSVRSKTDGEWWPTLLEKGLAKVNGSYQEIWAGMAYSEPGVLMYGGNLVIHCPKTADDHFESTRRYLAKNALVTTGTGTYDEDGNEVTVSRSEGLVQGHAYTILRVVDIPADGFRLICLRNTWGGFEWKGDWSDKSDMWDKYPATAKLCNWQRAEADDHDADDGIFWMEHKTHCSKFGGLHVYLPPGVDAEPGHEVMQTSYLWAFKPGPLKTKAKMNGAGATSFKEDITAPDALVSTCYSMATAPQFRVSVTEATTVRFFADRRAAAPTATIQPAAATNVGGRCLRGEREDNEYDATKPSALGQRVEKTVLSQAFIDWSADVELSPGEYTVAVFAYYNAEEPVKFEFKADKEVDMSRIDPLPYESINGTFARPNVGSVYGDANILRHQYILTIAEPGRVLIELSVSDFDAFDNPDNACVGLFAIKGGEPLTSRDELRNRDGHMEESVYNQNYVSVLRDMEPGQYIVLPQFGGHGKAYELRVTHGQGDAGGVKLEPASDHADVSAAATANVGGEGGMNVQVDICSNDGMVSGSYSMATAPQKRLVVSEPTVVRFLCDRQSGGAPTAVLTAVDDDMPYGRNVVVKRDDEDAGGDRAPSGLGRHAADAEVLGKSFLDWSENIELQPGSFNISTFAFVNHEEAVQLQLQSDKQLQMTDVPTMAYASIGGKFTEENPGELFRDPDAEAHQVVLTLREPGKVLIEYCVQGFSAFDNPKNASVSMFGKTGAGAAQSWDEFGDAGFQYEGQVNQNYLSLVRHMDAGSYVLLLGFGASGHKYEVRVAHSLGDDGGVSLSKAK